MLDTLQRGILQAGIIDFDWSLVFVLVLFLVFWLALEALVVKPMRAAHEQRFERMAGARTEAERMDLRAAEAWADYQRRLGAARAHALTIREGLQSEAAERAAESLGAVRREAEGSLSAGRSVLAEAADKARVDIAPKVEELGVHIADHILSSPHGGTA